MKTHAVATALGALVLGGTLLAPTSDAAAETCHGQPATLVGTPGQDLVGTAGPDVIVTNGAMVVRALDGGDLICVTGQARHVNAGYGDDTVDATVRVGPGKTTLGWGSDTFTGGLGFDEVDAGGTEDPVVSDGAWYDGEPDMIDTGKGGANVRSGEDWASTVGTNDDVIVLGAPGPRRTNSVHYAGEMGPAGRLEFAPGRASLSYAAREWARYWNVDNGGGYIRTDGDDVVRWSGQLHRLALGSTSQDDRTTFLTFLGTPADEVLEWRCCGHNVRGVARMRGGRDRAFLTGTARAVAIGARGADLLVGGRGNDELYGGPGRDKAIGRRGVDICEAEITGRCERS